MWAASSSSKKLHELSVRAQARRISISLSFSCCGFERQSVAKVLDLLSGTKRYNTIFTLWKQQPVVDQRLASCLFACLTGSQSSHYHVYSARGSHAWWCRHFFHRRRGHKPRAGTHAASLFPSRRQRTTSQQTVPHGVILFG